MQIPVDQLANYVRASYTVTVVLRHFVCLRDPAISIAKYMDVEATAAIEDTQSMVGWD